MGTNELDSDIVSMLEALNRECKDIAMLIAHEVHKDYMKALNIEYNTTFTVGSTILLKHSIGSAYNYRCVYNISGQIKMHYNAIYNNSGLRAVNLRIPLPKYYVFSSGLTYISGYK